MEGFEPAVDITDAAQGNGLTEPEPDQEVEAPVGGAGDAQAAEDVERDMPVRGLYLVRIPKPIIEDNEQERKRLQVEFQESVAKLKELNAVLQEKRGVMLGLKQQMNEARGLKERTEPEYTEKSDRMQQLRKVRDGYIALIDDIKTIGILEHRLAHEGLPLREEKQVVTQISKLKIKVKDYDAQKNNLAELESECAKVKALITDMEGEFGVIKTEHNATWKVVQGIGQRLADAKAEVEKLQDQQTRLTKAKEAVLEQMDGLRRATNDKMEAYRENRKVSLTVRDMMAAGQRDEAKALIDAQVDQMVNRLATDKKFRDEYMALWPQQRKYLCAEILPKSCANPVELPQGRGEGGRGGRGGRGAPRAPPPEPRGEEKAKLLIDRLLAEASQEAARARGEAVAVITGTSDGDADVEEEAAVPAKKPVDAAKQVAAAKEPAPPGKLVEKPHLAAQAAFKDFKVELPKLPDVEFVPPVIKSDSQQELSKEALREEQRLKAAEAEERKRRRAEAAERKRLQAAEAAKRLEQERRERDAAARAAAAERRAAAQAATQPPVASEQEGAAGADSAEPAEVAVATAATAGSRGVVVERASKAAPKAAFEKKPSGSVVRRPKATKSPLLKQAKHLWANYQGPIIFGLVMLFVFILCIAFLMLK